MMKLSKSQSTPKQLSDEYDIAISHISRALTELEEKQLVKCLNPNRTKGRFYGITEDGKEVLKKVKELL